VDSSIAGSTFASYTVDRPLAAVQDLTEKLASRLRPLPGGTVGIESEHLPAAILDRLRSACPQLEYRDITPAVARMRMIKDEDEIETIL
jgi:Xaa-Pro aminopeptidase